MTPKPPQPKSAPTARTVSGPPHLGKSFLSRRRAIEHPRVVWVDCIYRENLGGYGTIYEGMTGATQAYAHLTNFDTAREAPRTFKIVIRTSREEAVGVLSIVATAIERAYRLRGGDRNGGETLVVVDEIRILTGRSRMSLGKFDNMLRKHGHLNVAVDLISQRYADMHPDAATICSQHIIFGAHTHNDREHIRKIGGPQALEAMAKLAPFQWVRCAAGQPPVIEGPLRTQHAAGLTDAQRRAGVGPSWGWPNW